MDSKQEPERLWCSMDAQLMLLARAEACILMPEYDKLDGDAKL